MIPSLTKPLVLNEGVLIIPVADLPDEARKQIDCDPGDFAVSRLQSRSSSKIIDANAAELLSRFSQKRTIVEAVILFARGKGLEPEKVLEDAYPFFRSMTQEGFLVPSDADSGAKEGGAGQGKIVVGSQVLGAAVRRTLNVLEDTELFLLSRGTSFSVLKIERLSPQTKDHGPVRARLKHEAAFLASLGGLVAPKLRAQGELEGRFYLELEFIEGSDAAAASVEWRERGGARGRRALLELAQAISFSYARLHEGGIAHGDVHPGNVLVRRDGSTVLIDFGVAHPIGTASSLPRPPDRGGIPFFFEPEMALAGLAGLPSPPVSEAGEQHAVAALIFFLVTGSHWQKFRLRREAMLQDIAALPPLSFQELGVLAWPELEDVLRRALAKLPEQRFPSMSMFAGALAAVAQPSEEGAAQPAITPVVELLDRMLLQASPEGAWSQAVFTPAPTTSINYGSAGVALGLLQIAMLRNDGALLAAADTWSRRAIRELARDDAFYNEKIEITPKLVGRSSPYHSPSGVHAVAALVGVAAANPASQMEGLSGFLQAAQQPPAGLDLTLGRAGILLGTAILLDAVPETGPIDLSPLRSLGNNELKEIWQALDGKAEIAAADVEYPGIAHGWAGFLYATLQWCNVSSTPFPPGVEQRLGELAKLALPGNRGLDWPWTLGQSGEPQTMPGWCNGACGYVFLWTLAYRLLGTPSYLDFACGAAWRSWDAPEPTVTLCCGLAGRAYALLNYYRLTKETLWLERARDLALRAVRNGNAPKEYPHSLYKGEFGLAVLAASLEQPDEARMPFFEPLGYRSGR